LQEKTAEKLKEKAELWEAAVRSKKRVPALISNACTQKYLEGAMNGTFWCPENWSFCPCPWPQRR